MARKTLLSTFEDLRNHPFHDCLAWQSADWRCQLGLILRPFATSPYGCSGRRQRSDDLSGNNCLKPGAWRVFAMFFGQYLIPALSVSLAP